MGGFPGLHDLDHCQVVYDRAPHPIRYRDKLKHMRATLRSRPKIMDEIVPAPLIQRIPDLQEHPVIVGKRKWLNIVFGEWVDGRSLRFVVIRRHWNWTRR